MKYLKHINESIQVSWEDKLNLFRNNVIDYIDSMIPDEIVLFNYNDNYTLNDFRNDDYLTELPRFKFDGYEFVIYKIRKIEDRLVADGFYTKDAKTTNSENFTRMDLNTICKIADMIRDI